LTAPYLSQGEILLLKALLEARALAGALAKEVQAGAADTAVAFNDYFVDARGARQEGTLNTNPIASHTANREGRACAVLMGVQDGTLELLDTLAVAFLNLYVHANDVTRAESRDIRIYRCLNGFNQFAHWKQSLPVDVGRCRNTTRAKQQAHNHCKKNPSTLDAEADYTIKSFFVCFDFSVILYPLAGDGWTGAHL
jgi:hypothetical protein